MLENPRPINWVPEYIGDPVGAYEQGADDIYYWAYLRGFETALMLIRYAKRDGQASYRRAAIEPAAIPGR